PSWYVCMHPFVCVWYFYRISCSSVSQEGGFRFVLIGTTAGSLYVFDTTKMRLCAYSVPSTVLFPSRTRFLNNNAINTSTTATSTLTTQSGLETAGSGSVSGSGLGTYGHRGLGVRDVAQKPGD